MVKVYFENLLKYAEVVAIFDDEETYAACLPALERLCKKRNFDRITESVEDTPIDNIVKPYIPKRKPKYFRISGYWKNGGQRFEDKIVKSTLGIEESEEHDVFRYGMSEHRIKNEIARREKTGHNFVITSYSVIDDTKN